MRILNVFLMAMLITGLAVSCGKKEEKKEGEKAEKKEEEVKCPEATSFKVMIPDWKMDTVFVAKESKILEQKTGILKFMMRNYEGPMKTEKDLKGNEMNISVTIYNDYNKKPRPELAAGKYGMGNNKDNNSASYTLETSKGKISSWWTAGGDGGKNTFDIEAAKVTDKAICGTIKGEQIKWEGQKFPAISIDGELNVEF